MPNKKVTKMNGTVYQINAKRETPGERGIPKLKVGSARILRTGLEGDFNRYRTEKKHGTPDYALLLLPIETIQQLQNEKWQVSPGDLGENITVSGLDKSAMGVGNILKVGDAVIQIAKEATPCGNLKVLPFINDQNYQAFKDALIGRRGMYARVLEEGIVRTNDPIQLIRK